MELKGSKTEQHLKAAFAGEVPGQPALPLFRRQRPTWKATTTWRPLPLTAEGRPAMPMATSNIWRPAGHPATGLPIGPTADNPARCRRRRNPRIYRHVYPGHGQDAREEGFAEIADWFETLAKAERSHANATPGPQRTRRLNPWAGNGGFPRPVPHFVTEEQSWLHRSGRQPGSPNPPCLDWLNAEFTDRDCLDQEAGAGLWHLPWLPPLRQPVQRLPDPFRPGRQFRPALRWMASPKPISPRSSTIATSATSAP